jgi:16S rRNA (guanine527-N7)-methyltransferase
MVRSDKQICTDLEPYGITASLDLCNAIRRYTALLLQWNERISLTTITEPVEIVRFHFGESLFAASAVPIRNGRLADVGSGGGFPGLALKLAIPDLDVTLIEANIKKATFLSEVVRDLKLDRVSVARSRMEDFSAGENGFDFITARALGRHSDLLSWVMDNLAREGRVVLWLGEKDCSEISKRSGWNWHEPIHIPGSKRRSLLIGSRIV